MDFSSATRRYEDLLRRKNVGEIDDGAFQEGVAAIRVEDESGYSWCLDAAGNWYYWDGSTWVASTSSQQSSGGGPGLDTHQSTGSPAGAADFDQVFRKAFRWIPMGLAMLRGRMPPASVFLQQTRHVPLKKRSQSWWDAVAIMGGATGGFLWFLYSSVRGMPHFAPLGLSNESYFDFLPPMVMAALAVLGFLFRRQIAQALRPIMAPFRKIPLIGRLGLGGVFLLVGMWVRYRSGLFVGREGLDLITPMLMLFLPILIVLFRKPLDAVLLPFDPIRRKIPRIILVILGLAAPYLVAHVVYYWFNMAMYPFLRVSVCFGTMISYAILRTPKGAAPRKPRPQAAVGSAPPPLPGGPTPPRMSRRMAWVGLVWMLGLHLLFLAPVCADDFFRDPFNGNDGLRTPVVATAMAGTVTVVVSGLVNGAEVVRTIIEAQSGEDGSETGGGSAGEGAGAAGSGEGGEEQEPRQVQIVVSTVDQQGGVGTTLEMSGNQAVFIYAYCVEVGKGPLPGADDTLSFHLVAGSPFVFLSDFGRQGGQRCASVQIEDPLPDGMPPESVVVSVSAIIEGERISVPVSLSLMVAPYRIRFR